MQQSLFRYWQSIPYISLIKSSLHCSTKSVCIHTVYTWFPLIQSSQIHFDFPNCLYSRLSTSMTNYNTKIWVFFQKKICLLFHSGLSQTRTLHQRDTTCTIKIAHHYLSIMITAIILKQWIQTPSSHTYYRKVSLHFRGHPIFNLTQNETVKQWMKWYFLIVSLHKYLFQLCSAGYQPRKKECTSSPTWTTSPQKSELHKFSSSDNTLLSPCSPPLSHAQMFWMISCDILNTVSRQNWIVLIIIQTPSKYSERNVICSLSDPYEFNLYVIILWGI
jgi:hypothetical protein